MNNIQIEIPEIPHGHGLSFKKGVSDGLLGSEANKNQLHETHLASYERGFAVGEVLKERIAVLVNA